MSRTMQELSPANRTHIWGKFCWIIGGPYPETVNRRLILRLTPEIWSELSFLAAVSWKPLLWHFMGAVCVVVISVLFLNSTLSVHPVIGVLVFLPRSGIILDNYELLAAKILNFFICCQDLGFLRFLAKISAINLAKKPKKNQDLAKKSKIMPVEIRKENHSCFYICKLGLKDFSSFVKLRLLLWLPFLRFAELTESINWFRSKFTPEAKRNM